MTSEQLDKLPQLEPTGGDLVQVTFCFRNKEFMTPSGFLFICFKSHFLNFLVSVTIPQHTREGQRRISPLCLPCGSFWRLNSIGFESLYLLSHLRPHTVQFSNPAQQDCPCCNAITVSLWSNPEAPTVAVEGLGPVPHITQLLDLAQRLHHGSF